MQIAGSICIYSGLRAEQTKLCALVVMRMNAERSVSWRSTTAYGNLTQSWREVWVQLKSHDDEVGR